MKQLTSLVLALVMLFSLCCPIAQAASTPEEALGKVDIYSGGYPMSYLAVNGKIQRQEYTYFLYVDKDTNSEKEIPAYCVNPNLYGVPQTVGKGESIEYLADEKASDPKVVGIIANCYPHRGLVELGLDSAHQAFYAGKIALWCYLIPEWDISKVTVNPNLTGDELERAQRLLEAVKKIYTAGMAWDHVPTPQLTTVADQETAYPVTVDGKAYYQQIFTLTSDTWVCNYAVKIEFQNPEDIPQGTRITDLDNKDITVVTTGNDKGIYTGQFKVLYPAESIEGKTGSVQFALSADVYKYAVFYAICQETDEYGSLQNYLCDTDPQTAILRSGVSKYASTATPSPTPDTPTSPTPTPGTPSEPEPSELEIIKYEQGTEVPLAGASFEVKGPKGDVIGVFTTGPSGKVTVPAKDAGSYTVREVDPPKYHLLDDEPTKTVTVRPGETARLTFHNQPYGDLRIEKVDGATGSSLAGARIQIKHIESGATYTGETSTGGSYTFTELLPGAYEIVELAAPEGWKRDPQTHTTTVVTGECVSYTLKNDALPGLKITKYDSQTHTTMSGVTFEIFKDTVSLGRYETDAMGEILLTNLQPGTYRVVEVDTGNTTHIIAPPQEVELTVGGGIKELIFLNDHKPGMWLVKVDSADPSKVIPNAVFVIRAVDGSFGPKEFTTDRNGEIDLSALPTGSYEVVEKSCEGYIIDQAQRIIHLEANQTARFVFTNTIKPSLNLIKLSSDGSRLEGVTFRIAKIEDGTHYLDRTTNAQGEILISDLEPGVYSVRETATLNNHIIDLREYHVELFPGKTSTLVIENHRRPNLTIYKRDADTGEPIPNTVFLVKAADGHSVNEVKTDTDGKAVLENLLPGVYEVSEKSVPAPWLTDAPPQLVTLYPNRDRAVYFENHKKPTLTINKVDSITGSPIKGAKFEVWYGSNNTTTGELNSLGTFFSDENGQIVIDNLRDGWYRVTELEPAAGFTIKEPATQEFYIKGGESKTITYENVPLNAIIIEKYDSVTGEALPGCTFQLKYLGGTSGTGGTVIGTKVTGKNGTAIWTGLKPGTYIAEEVDPADGYSIIQSSETIFLADSGEQSVVTVRFANAPDGTLLIRKVCATNPSVTLQNAEFKVVYSDGTLIGDSNGIFRTDEAGEIRITGLKPGKSVVVTETRAPSGFLIDTQSQTIQIKAGRTVTLTFKNQPKGHALDRLYQDLAQKDQTVIDRLVEAVLPDFWTEGTAQYDSWSVTQDLGHTNRYWLIAIGSVRYRQDLYAMDGAALEALLYDKLTYSATLVERVLHISVQDLSPEAYMDALGFTQEEKDWAALLYSVLAEEQYLDVEDSDGGGHWNTDYGDVLFSDTETPVVYYNQTDARWGNLPYGKTGTIAMEGCGPAALAIAVSTLTGQTVTPLDVANWSAANGYRCEGNGSYHTLIPAGGAHYGLQVTGIGNDSRRLVEALQEGKLVIALMSKGHFTRSGHFIVLRGVTAEGNILVADPASVKRSGQSWALGIITNEARRGAGAGGPFWVLSR